MLSSLVLAEDIAKGGTRSLNPSKPVWADQRGEAGFRIPGGRPVCPRAPVPSAEVLGVFKTGGVDRRRWPAGAQAAIPDGAESSQVFGTPAVAQQGIL